MQTSATLKLEMIIREELENLREFKPDNLMPYQPDNPIVGGIPHSGTKAERGAQLVRQARRQMDGMHDMMQFIAHHPHEILDGLQNLVIWIPVYGKWAYLVLGLIDAGLYAYEGTFEEMGIELIETAVGFAIWHGIEKYLPGVLQGLSETSWKKIFQTLGEWSGKSISSIEQISLSSFSRAEQAALRWIIANSKHFAKLFGTAIVKGVSAHLDRLLVLSTEKIAKLASPQAQLAAMYVKRGLESGLLTAANVSKYLLAAAGGFTVVSGVSTTSQEIGIQGWIMLYQYFGLDKIDLENALERNTVFDYTHQVSEGKVPYYSDLENMTTPEQLLAERTKILAERDAKLDSSQKQNFNVNDKNPNQLDYFIKFIPVSTKVSDIQLFLNKLGGYNDSDGEIRKSEIDKATKKAGVNMSLRPHLPLAVDGKFGDKTASAVAAVLFQGQTNLYLDLRNPYYNIAYGDAGQSHWKKIILNIYNKKIPPSALRKGIPQYDSFSDFIKGSGPGSPSAPYIGTGGFKSHEDYDEVIKLIKQGDSLSTNGALNRLYRHINKEEDLGAYGIGPKFKKAIQTRLVNKMDIIAKQKTY